MMATADEYAAWIVKNESKKGTPDFETVAKAYAEAKVAEQPSAKQIVAADTPTHPALQALLNVPGSAANFAKGIAQTVMHPIDTAGGMLDAAAGGLRNITPGPLQRLIDKADTTPEAKTAQARAGTAADALGQHFNGRYGGANEIGTTLVADPVGAAADLSTLLTGGATLAGRLPMVAGPLAQAARLTNPLSAVAPAAQVLGTAGKSALGLTTGVGAENIAQAARSGFKGGVDDFAANLKGAAAQTDVLDKAKLALENMAREKAASYRANMADVSKDKAILDFKGIDKALSEAKDVTSYKGQTTNVKASDAVGKMADAVDEWKALDPKEFHTPEGLDALKKRLGGVLESIPYEEKTARLAAGKVYSAVKAEITQQAPTYARAMSEYSNLSDEITQIERALSLGKKASVDTAMRKLQSLARNNANTNYGERLSMAKTLEGKGGVELMPAIAGQALNSWTPRGLAGQMGSIGSAAMAYNNPATLSLLPFMSPRLMGEAAYRGGRVAGTAGRGLESIGVNPERARIGGLLASQSGLFPGPADW
jgi:hypothetical protein